MLLAIAKQTQEFRDQKEKEKEKNQPEQKV